jgi:spore germination protein KB
LSSKQITGKQMQAIIIMHILGSSFVLGATSKTKQDTWITLILGGAMALPMIFVYCALIRKYPGKNLFEIIIVLFGKIIGKAVCILYVWYALHLSSMVLRTFTEFIHILNMPETPEIVIACFMVLLAVWAATSGVENIGRVAKFSFLILLSFIMVTLLISYKDMNFNNLKPVMSTDFGTLLGASYTAFSLPFGELIVFLTIFPCVKSKSSPKKIYIKALIFSTVLLVLAHLRNLLVLGVTSVGMYVFPSYQAVSVMSVGEFFTRMEVLIGSIVLLAGFIKICVFLFTSSVGLAKVFNLKDYKKMTAPCGLIIVLLSRIDFENAPGIIKWTLYHPIYVLPFQVILPIILLITALIKAPKKRPNTPPEPENIESLE